MANIILIEDDRKVERQIRGFLNELDDQHRVRYFSDGRSFEEKYFQGKKPSPMAESLDVHPISKTWSPEEVEWLKAQSLASVVPFATDFQPIYNLATKKILKAGKVPEKIFNLPSSSLVGDLDAWAAMVPEKVRPLWEGFLGGVKASGLGEIWIPVNPKDSGIWIMHVKGKVNKDALTLTVEDCTKEIRHLVAKAKGEKLEEGEDDEFQLVSKIDVVIFKTTNVDRDVPGWVGRVQKLMKEQEYWPDGSRTRFVALKYEDDGVAKSSMLHPYLDDLVFLPLDRLIFLQKMEIILAMPENTKPSILFIQEADMEIEISKRSRIERLTDVGFAVRNPVPLVEGLLGHFYFKFPDSKEWVEVYAKAQGSQRHPEDPKTFLVYFTFFGIKKETLSIIRRHLHNNPNHKNFHNQDPSHFVFNPDDVFLGDEDRRKRTVAIVDMDHDAAKSLSEMIRQEMGQVHVVTENSLSRFLKRYVESGAKAAGGEQVKAATAQDFYSDPVAWSIDWSTQNLVKLYHQPATPENNKILGHEVDSLFKEPQGWLKLFAGSDGQGVLLEAIQVAVSGQKVKTDVDLKLPTGEMRKVELEVRQEGVTNEVRVSLAPPKEMLGATEPLPAKLPGLDLLIVDHGLVPQDIPAWIENLNNSAHASGLIPKGQRLKVIVLGPAKENGEFQRYAENEIYAYFVKPVERRLLMYSAALALNNPFTLFRFDNIFFSETNLLVNIAKRAKLTHFSEFGACFRHNRPIAPGTPLFLHKGIFEQAPDGNLLTRVYYSEEDANEKDQMLCWVLYFGINDSFLKYTRSFIRENYASKKSESGGGGE